MKLNYNKELKQKARELRKAGILSEALLWNQIKARKMKGYQFNRQKPIDDYITDFFCGELKLVIEIDGVSHINKHKADEERQKKLESFGLTVLRFYDEAVKQNMDGVLRSIEKWIDEAALIRGN